jgi:malonate-semialdehyde dehydrogenase (acetylating) / methylmalonate-semialdehyde dehydrogenase
MATTQSEPTSATQIRTIRNYIGGRWVAPHTDRVLDVVNPANQSVLAHVPLSGPEDLAEAVAAARLAFPAWRSHSTIQRARWLFSLRQQLVEERDELARLVVTEMGKTFADAGAEVDRMIEMVEAATAVPTTMQGRVLENVATNVDCETIRQPVGVCAAIVPFNFPAMVPFWFLPFAIATGNTFVLKPSEQVPLTQNRVFEIIDGLDLPAGVVNLVNGDADVANAILESPGIDAVSFVGSAPVAKHVYATAAAHGKRVQALGGAKNHMVVMPDAVIDRTVEGIITSAFGAAGQRCMAGSVVVTVADAAQALLEPLVAATAELRVGDGLDPDVAVGPVISCQARARIERAIDAAVAEGAQLAIDGRRGSDGPGAFVGPTILTGVRPDMAVVDQEVFGPVLVIIEAADLAEAIAIVNASPYGNGTSIFTESAAAVRRYRHDVEAGMVGVNIGVAAPVAFFPFSGWKASFFGDLHAHGTDAVDFYTRKKTITSRFFSEQTNTKLFGEH